MSSDFERLLSEDEAARAGVEAARLRAAARLERARAEIAGQREARVRALQRDVDRQVEQIGDEAQREIERRRSQGDASRRERAARTAPIAARAVDLWLRVVRGSPMEPKQR
jgi:hypothetical protein